MCIYDFNWLLSCIFVQRDLDPSFTFSSLLSFSLFWHLGLNMKVHLCTGPFDAVIKTNMVQAQCWHKPGNRYVMTQVDGVYSPAGAASWTWEVLVDLESGDVLWSFLVQRHLLPFLLIFIFVKSIILCKGHICEVVSQFVSKAWVFRRWPVLTCSLCSYKWSVIKLFADSAGTPVHKSYFNRVLIL